MVKKSLIHVTSFAAKVRVIYWALVDDKVTVGCFLEHQLTRPSFSIKIKPEFDFLISLLFV